MKWFRKRKDAIQDVPSDYENRLSNSVADFSGCRYESTDIDSGPYLSLYEIKDILNQELERIRNQTHTKECS